MGRPRRWVTSVPRWGWQVGVLAAGSLLVWQSRFLVVGLLTAAAIGFAGAVVLLGAWMLLGLARPGWHVSAEGPRAAARHLLGQMGHQVGLAHRVVGRAPWRGPQQVLNAVAEQVCEQVATLPGAPTAVRTVVVHLHPDTVSALDAWMPIEDVARHWARGYAAQHNRLPSETGKVSVLVVSDDQAPLNRARVSSSFRNPEHRQSVALASAPLAGPRLDPARGKHTMLRVDHPAPPAPAAPPRPASSPAHDGRTRLDPDRTRHMYIKAAAQGHPVAADSTQVLTPPAPPPPATASLERLLLVPVHPTSAEPTGQEPLTLLGPRARVGRGADQDLSLANSHVSRQHAEIRLVSSGWIITDQGSTRGTYLNGRQLEPGVPHHLANGDLIEIGRPDRGGSPTAYHVTDPAASRAA